MSERLNYYEQSPDLAKKLHDLAAAIKKSSLGDTLADLVNIRASQLNGCAMCLDMHCKEAKIHGERELRLYHVPIWRESTFSQTRRERRLSGRRPSPGFRSMVFRMTCTNESAHSSTRRRSLS